jgi:hypothetical protein
MKIISGGQTGVDMAALEMALCLGMNYGGSIPKGRLTEAGPLDLKYNKMTELKSSYYSVRTKKNIIDSDATLIIMKGKLTGGTALTRFIAQDYGKSCLCVNLQEQSKEQAINNIKKWLKEIKPQILNIAGPRESNCPGIYEESLEFFVEVFNNE